jgi:hypothetical protein
MGTPPPLELPPDVSPLPDVVVELVDKDSSK